MFAPGFCLLVFRPILSELVTQANLSPWWQCRDWVVLSHRFVRDGEYDFEELRSVTKVLTRNLNRVIDVNFYPDRGVKGGGFAESA